MKNLCPRTKLASLLTATCLAVAPAALAVSPPPDGGYPNGNTAEGTDALFSLTTGSDNTAVGFDALHDVTIAGSNTAVGSDALHHNTAVFNTAVGSGALSSNTTGTQNSALGFAALDLNTTGSDNTALGYLALWSNATGTNNTGVGAVALSANSSGSRNVAVGENALNQNVGGSDNTAVGVNALSDNTANYNTATGYQALESNTTGSNNAAHGIDTLDANTTGSDNTASGAFALFSNNTGANNTAIGFDALYNNTTANSNTAVGLGAMQNNTTGGSNIALGLNAGFNLTTGSNNIDIGNNGVAGDSARIRIGTKPTHKNTFIAGIFGVPVPTGVAVLIDNTGHLGTTTSSARFKDAIKPMDKTSEAILALQPVTFRYKKELDPDGIPQFGLVAEQVEKVNPDLVARDDQGKPYTVRYEAVNAMLLNEFLKEHRKVEELEASIGELKSSLARQQKDFQSAITEQRRTNEALTAALQAQAAQIQKVSDQLRTQAAAPRVVAEN